MLELRSCLNSLPIKSCKQNMMLSFINAPCSSKFCPFFNPGDKGGIDPLVLWERNKDPICAYFYKSFYALTLFKSCSHCFCRDSNMFAWYGEKIYRRCLWRLRIKLLNFLRSYFFFFLFTQRNPVIAVRHIGQF